MKKRNFKLAAIAMLCVAVVASGCGSKKDDKKADKKAEKVEIGFSQEGGVYGDAFTLTIDSADSAEIYYTVDGSDPRTSESAVLYEGGIEIKDRTGEANVVSAIDPLLIQRSFVNYSKNNGVTTWMKAPADDAVDKCTVVRAAVKNSDGTFENPIGATYFVGTVEDHIEGIAESCQASGKTLAVVSITMNYDDLFDYDTGIYVAGAIFDENVKRYNGLDDIRKVEGNYNQRGREWEREAHVDFFEMNGSEAQLEFSQNCGIRVQGNYSRSDLVKGFRLYARDSYGPKKFKYGIWGNENIEKYKTFVLRAGGNCAFNSKYNDTYWQTLADNMGLMCDTKDSRPCVVYLNGEYWGLYVLEEDYSDNYFEDHYGVDKDDVIVYKGDGEAFDRGYKLDIGEVPEGQWDSYYFNDLTKFIGAHTRDFADDAVFAEFGELVDIESLRDYFALEVWINNKWDWPGKNWGMWKAYTEESGKYADNKYGDGKWRFMYFDVEFGGVSGSGDAYTNTLKEDNYKPLGLLDTDTDNIAVKCFLYSMKNKSFRDDFFNRLNEISEYFDANATDVLDDFEGAYGPLFDQFFDRYPKTGSRNDAINGGYASSKCIRDFVTRRSGYVPKMIEWARGVLE